MNSQDSLNQLIHSLSKTEKRNFRLFASRHTKGEGNDYLLLFDFHRANPGCLRSLEKSYFKGTAIGKHLAAARNYLYNVILDSLESYSALRTAEDKLKRKLIHSRLLLDRNLPAQALKILEKAEKSARNYYLTPLLIQVLNLKREALKGASQMKRDLQAEVMLSLLKATELEQQISRYRYYYARCFALATKSGSRELKRQIEEIEAEMEKFQLLKRPASEDFRLQLYFLSTCYQLSRLKKDEKNGTPLLEFMLDLFDRHPHMISLYETRYLALLQNLAGQYLMALRLGRAKELLQKMEKYSPRLPASQNLLFEAVYFLRFDTNLSAFRQVKVEDCFLDFERDLWALSAPPRNGQLLHRYNQVIDNLICNKKFHLVIPWIRRFWANPEHKRFEYIHRSVELALLLTHFAMGNDEILEYELRNYQNRIKSEGADRPLEQLMHAFFQNCILHRGTQENNSPKAAYEQVHEALHTEEDENSMWNWTRMRKWTQIAWEHRSSLLAQR